LLRDATSNDLSDLRALARIFNTLNLPDNKEELVRIIDESERSFAGEIEEAREREFLFVLEELSTGRVVGTSRVVAQHGTRDKPHVFLDVFEEELYSKTLDKYFRHTLLRLGFDYDGPTEIGGLVVHPDYRGAPGKLGKQLSFTRFLFVAMHRAWFRGSIVAEVLPPLGQDGRSALWEALGRRYTGMDYHEADIVSKHNKDFIRSLFPSGPVHTTLFDDEARSVIGQVGPKSMGAKKMLESIGFRQVDRVDPFDGGPHFHATTDEIWPVSRSAAGVVKIGDRLDITEAPGESADGLVAFEPPRDRGAGWFRCMFGPWRRRDDEVEIPSEVAEALRVEAGETAWVLPWAEHKRL
jgi:arginine N-succinyltransferase